MPERPSDKLAGHCTQCGAALRAGAQFCTACGAPAAAAPSAPVPPASRPAAPASSQRKGLWLLLGAALLIVAAVAVFALLEDAQQPAASPPVAIPAAPVAAQDIPFPNVTRVSVENAHMMAMTGDAVIVDVRDKPFYDSSRIRGALSLPLNDLPARYAELPRDKAVLTYCT
jgi:hypothetical protein